MTSIPSPGPAIGKGLPDISHATLTRYAQLGVEQVAIPTRWNTQQRPRPLVPPSQLAAAGPQPEPWDATELTRIMARCREHGLEPTGAALPLSGAILLGRDDRESDLQRVLACIRVAGNVGLQVLTYNFTALRAAEGYGALPGRGRGGADLRDFDAARIAGLPPLPDVGAQSYEEMWERLAWFLEAALPVAEAAGVRLALHPNDPPVPSYRGVAQPLSTLADWRRLLALSASRANTLFFDTGVTTELGEDAPAAIRELGERIAIVHFRNVRVLTPRSQYVETLIDEGDCDMAACMHAFCEIGFLGMVDPDHTPHLTGDGLGTPSGWAYALGYMRALRAASVANGIHRIVTRS